MPAQVLLSVDAQGRENVSAFDRCAELLLRGSIVVLPTETVYGIAADATQDEACKLIFHVKQRPKDNPLIVHCVNVEDALCCVDGGEMHEENYTRKAQAYRYARELLIHHAPGPLTIIAYASERVCRTARAGGDTIAVRVPQHPVFAEIMRRVKKPLAAPSANISGRPSATNAHMAYAELGDEVAAIVDGGDSRIGLESTIVDCTQNPPSVVRPGVITRDEVAATLTKMLHGFEKKQERFLYSPPVVPGAKYQHYKPRCKVYARDARSVGFLSAVEKRMCTTSMCLCVKSRHSVDDALEWKLCYKYENWDDLAQALYAKFVHAEETHCEAVFVDMPSESSEHEALYNRIVRASA